VDLDGGATFPSSSSLPKFVEQMLLPSGYYYYNLPTDSLNEQKNYSCSTTNANNEHAIKTKQDFTHANLNSFTCKVLV
jgi:hypothetical protein